MIELLIKYIQDKGYQVKIRPPVDLSIGIFPAFLHIFKEAKGQIFNYAWAIPKHELHPDFEELLYYQATRKCDEIEKAIDEYTSVQPDS